MKKLRYKLSALTLLVACATAHAQVFDVTITPTDGYEVFSMTNATRIEIKPGDTEHIQYFMLDADSNIRVAQYYTELPSKEVLADRLQRAIAIAREHQIDNKYTKQ